MYMSVKHGLKRDGSDKNKENQPRREAESYADPQKALSTGKPKDKPPFSDANESDRKHKD
jgi:hypothetical protein